MNKGKLMDIRYEATIIHKLFETNSSFHMK